MKKSWIILLVAGALTALALNVLGPTFHPEPVHAQTPGESFHCVVTVTTVLVITAVGGPCASVQPNESLYITDILSWANSSGIAADSFNTLKYGLTTASVTVFWGGHMNSVNITPTIQDFTTPIRIPAGNQIYFINATAGSKFFAIDGYKGAP